MPRPGDDYDDNGDGGDGGGDSDSGNDDGDAFVFWGTEPRVSCIVSLCSPLSYNPSPLSTFYFGTGYITKLLRQASNTL